VNDRSLANRAVTVTLIVVAAWAAWTASQWRYEVRFAPLVTSIAFGLLALIQLLRTELPALRRRGAAATDEATGTAADDTAGTTVPVAAGATGSAGAGPTEAAVTETAADAERPVGAVPEAVAAITGTPAQGTLVREPDANDPGLLGPWKGAFWCFLCLGLVIAGGILLGLPIAIFVLCRFAFGERWLVTIGAVLMTIGILWVFDTVFNVFWPVGLAFQWLYA
jgi:hypothetical protein